MRLVEIIRNAEGMKMVDEDGNVEHLRLLPAISETELNRLRASIPCPLPEEIEEVLRHTRGFENGPLESVDFSGGLDFEFEELLPHGLPVAHDGFGNFWVVDLTSASTEWGPLFFVCHDPPVIAYQTAHFHHFIGELLRFANPPHESELDFVHEQVSMQIWSQNPGLRTVEQCLQGTMEPHLRAFAEMLDDSFYIIDLRDAKIGDGFSWGRFGPRTVVKRFGEERIFACQRKTFFQRLFGR